MMRKSEASPRRRYLPIVFFQGHAFSGFNNGIAEALQMLLSSAGDEH